MDSTNLRFISPCFCSLRRVSKIVLVLPRDFFRSVFDQLPLISIDYFFVNDLVFFFLGGEQLHFLWLPFVFP